MAHDVEWLDEMEYEPASESELAFLEMGSEQDESEELEQEGEMDEEMAFDEDSEFLEADSEADSESEFESESDSDSDSDSDSELDLDSDLESTTLIVNEFPLSHEQDADPIMTEKMEQDALFDELGLLESEADSEVDSEADSELDSELDSETELESETEAETEAEATTEVSEDGVVHTPCGKKIIWEKRTEENPESQA